MGLITFKMANRPYRWQRLIPIRHTDPPDLLALFPHYFSEEVVPQLRLRNDLLVPICIGTSCEKIAAHLWVDLYCERVLSGAVTKQRKIVSTW